ncbi:hypothetical protein EJ07DRAFT_128969, partial [Lizonia empirigonia]
MSLEAALREIDRLKPGEKICYTDIAKKYGVVRSTLTRRHKAITTPITTRIANRRKLNPQQEIELIHRTNKVYPQLIKYIEELNCRSLPPTREMIQNFASKAAQNPVSESWVTRFINRHSIDLISKYSTGMDTVRHNADSYTKYELYFNMLRDK